MKSVEVCKVLAAVYAVSSQSSLHRTEPETNLFLEVIADLLLLLPSLEAASVTPSNEIPASKMLN